MRGGRPTGALRFTCRSSSVIRAASRSRCLAECVFEPMGGKLSTPPRTQAPTKKCGQRFGSKLRGSGRPATMPRMLAAIPRQRDFSPRPCRPRSSSPQHPEDTQRGGAFRVSHVLRAGEGMGQHSQRPTVPGTGWSPMLPGGPCQVSAWARWPSNPLCRRLQGPPHSIPCQVRAWGPIVQ